MIQFNIHRFGKLARWSLTKDKRYYVKTFLQLLVIMLLIFLFFTEMVNTNEVPNPRYDSCCLAVMCVFAVTFIMGPSFMFYNMEGKHDMQSLMILPASNFEKYLMRYATWIILIPLYVVAISAADLMQFLYHWVLGHDYGQFVIANLADTWSKIFESENASPNASKFWYASIVLGIWFHSIFALGATFFRSRKFNGVLSMLVIVLIGILILWLTPDHSALQYGKDSSTPTFVWGNVIYISWILLNFWLSYRLFCRTQVIGKFVNL